MSAGSRMPSAIGPYRVIDLLGSGGMGTVYRVSHRVTGAVVAAKVLHADSLGGTALERFRNEARIHQSLVHPCIARVHEYLELGDSPCLVMEYVAGETLDDHIRMQGPLDYYEALDYFEKLVDAVSYVHQRGVVHRDLKANNVKLDGHGGLKLLDFGIAKGAATPRMTSTGNVVGTLHSLSPEQLRTGRAEPRSDIWALGIVFYEMLTGRPPFDGMAPGLLTERILQGKYTAPSQLRPDLPREVDRIVERCLRVRVEDRYASCEALLTDIATVSGKASPAPSTVWRTPAVLLQQSGEVAQGVVREWRLVASGFAAAGALAFLVWATWPSSGSVPAKPAGPPAELVLDSPPTSEAATGSTVSDQPVRRAVLPPPPPPRAPAANNREPATRTGGPGGERVSLRRVMIRVVQGEATVFQDGVRVGITPYELEAPIGAEVSLLLRREGCEELPIKLRMENNMSEFMESFRRCSTP